MSAYIRESEVSGQVPGTTHGRARTISAINNTQASGYVSAQGAPKYRRRTPMLTRTFEEPRGRPYSTAPVAGPHQVFFQELLVSLEHTDTVLSKAGP